MLQPRLPPTTSKTPVPESQNRVTHSGNDDMDLKIYPYFTTIKPKAMGKHLVGLVQLSCEFIVLTSNTLNNVENLRAGALK